jgi:hypothetical protein
LGGEGRAHRLELFRQVARPGLPPQLGGGGDFQFALRRCHGDAGLEFRPQPADMAAKLLFRPLAVQRNQAREKIVIGEIGRPAIGGEDGMVEIVVQLPQHADKPAVVNIALGLAQFVAGAHLPKHVVKPGQGQIGMEPQPLLAQQVQFLGDRADRHPHALAAIRKRKRVETACFIITRVVTDALPATGGYRPDHVYFAR